MSAPIQWGPIIRAGILMGPAEAIAASCTSACLLGISLSKVFSLVFCVLLIAFAVVFGFIAWKSGEDRFMRVASGIGAVLMPIAGIGCIVVDTEFVHLQSSLAKTPLYVVIASAILINFSINIIQVINCCPWGNLKDRLLSNNKQVSYLFIMNIVLGVLLGLVFGLLDVEDASATSSKMTTVSIIFIFVGLIFGILFSIFSEINTQRIQSIGLDPLAQGPASTTTYDRM